MNHYTIYKIDKEIITFGNIEVEKHKFHEHKSPISIYDVGYENDYEKIILLCIILQKMSAYRRDFDETKYMSFFYKI